MNRRTFVKRGSAAFLALGAGGCAPAMSLGRASPRQQLTLAPVHVAWDRIIRTTTGLRPHRMSGFVLRAEQFDDKTVVHNFGHGGSGMSLSWGTAALAADLAVQHPSRVAAVLGCGINGLTTARVLQRRGFDVTIYARELPPYTTSNMSWAGFTPNSGLVTNRTPAFDAQFQKAVRMAYGEHQLLVGRDYGVSWIDSYSTTNNLRRPSAEDDDEEQDQLLPPDVELGSTLLEPGSHPFRTRYAYRQPTLRFEPSIYLDALMEDVVRFGGAIEVRTFDTPRDLMELPADLIVNATGLGSKTLFGDPELTPVKGQLTVLVPQPEVEYSMGGMMPRSDGIVLGHVQQRDEWSLEVDYEEQTRVMENAFRTLNVAGTVNVDLTRTTISAQSPPPVESFFALRS